MDYTLKLVLNGSGADPVALEGSQLTFPNGTKRKLDGIADGEVYLRALVIVLLLAKYRSDLIFEAPFHKSTWITTLVEWRKENGLKVWMKTHLGLLPDAFFFRPKQGSKFKYPSITYLSSVLPLKNVSLVLSNPETNLEDEIEGRALVKYARDFEKRYTKWENSAVSKLCPRDFNNKGEFIQKRADTSCEPSSVRDFLQRLASRGLATRMLFPPPWPNGQSLRSFCIEPRLITESQWRGLRERSDMPQHLPHEMELASEELMRAGGNVVAAPLGEILGDNERPACHSRVIIQGNPGEGKSIALWLHVGNQCNALIKKLDSWDNMDDPSFKIPLVLPLGEIKADTNLKLKELAIEKVLEIAYGDTDDPSAKAVRQWIKDKVENGQYTLALDAYDELSKEGAAVKWLKEQLQHLAVPILLTTRPNAADTELGLGSDQSSGEYEVYRMTCFGDEQVAQYVGRYFEHDKKKADLLTNHIKLSPGPRQLSRLPLLLATLCHVLEHNEPGQPLPSTRTELLGAALNELFAHGHRRRQLRAEVALQKAERQSSNLSTPNHLKELFLQKIAYGTWKSGPVPVSEKELRNQLEVDLPGLRATALAQGLDMTKLTASDLMEEFCGDGILVRIMVAGGPHYRFVLRSIHEYLLGGYFASEPIEESRKSIFEFVRTMGGNMATQLQVWPLAAGQCKRIGIQLLSIFRPDRYYIDYKAILSSHSFDSSFTRFIGRLIAETKTENKSYWIDSLLAKQRLQNTCCSALIGFLDEAGGDESALALLNIIRPSWYVYYAYHPEWKLYVLEAVEAFKKIATQASINVLIQMLSDEPKNNQYVYLAGRVGTIECRDALLSLFDDNDYCASALIAIGDELCQKAVMSRLKDSQSKPAMKRACIEALSDLQDDASVKAIGHCLTGSMECDEVREKCVIVLRRFNGSNSRNVLIRCLMAGGVGDLRIRQDCAVALGTLGGSECRSALTAMLASREAPAQLRVACANALKKIGDEVSLAALGDCMRNAENDDDARVRFECATELRLLESPECLPIVLTFFNNDHYPLTDNQGSQCVKTLVGSGCAASRAALIARLGNSLNPSTRAVQLACVQALIAMGGKASRSTLIDRLKNPANDPNCEVRIACAHGLGKMGDEASRSALIERLRDSSDDLRQVTVRVACVEALSSIGDETCIAVIQAQAKLKAMDHTGAVRFACVKFTGIPATSEWCDILIARLNSSVSDEDETIRESCIHSLAELGDESCRSALLSYFKLHPDLSGKLFTACVKSLLHLDEGFYPALIEVLKNASASAARRLASVKFLSSLTKTDCIGALVAVLDASNEAAELRMECARALGKIGGVEARTSLILNLRTEADVASRAVAQCCASALVDIGDETSTAALVERLLTRSNKEGDDAVRKECANSLGRIKDPHCCSILRTCLLEAKNDETGEIRAHCAHLLIQHFDGDISRQSLIKRIQDQRNDDSGLVRIICIRVLAKISGEEICGGFLVCLNAHDTPANVRQACYDALHDEGPACIVARN